MSNVTGFLIRTSLSDTGALPRGGDFTSCPDIIPVGTVAMSKNDLISTYDKVYSNKLQEGQTNYIYLRAKNMNSEPLTKKAWMFRVPGSLVLRPEVWYKPDHLLGHFVENTGGAGDPDNPYVKEQYGQTLMAEAGQIAVTDAFTWNPDTTEHSCLVGVVADSWDDILEGYPLGVGTMNDLAQWIYLHGSFGWHNVDFLPSTTTVFENKVAYENPDGEDVMVDFLMVVENVPVGSRISFSANTSTKSGEILGVDWVPIPEPLGGGTINKKAGTVSPGINVEAGYKTVITYKTDFNGKQPPADFKMHIEPKVTIPKPTVKNGILAKCIAKDNFKQSLSRAYSSDIVFLSPSGIVYGQGVEAYYKMCAEKNSGDPPPIKNQVCVGVGSHSTKILK